MTPDRYTCSGRTIEVMVVALLLVVALLVPSVGRSDGCSDVFVVGVRGSGQSRYGPQVSGTVDVLVDRIGSSGRTVTDVPLEYPAISVSDSFGLVLLNGEYDRSVRSGVQELRRVLAEETTRCGGSSIVLVGYSQGAQVIKESVAGSVPDVRIAALVLLADPTRDPSQPGVSRVVDSSTRRGGSFGVIPLPEHLRPVTIDVCAPGDVVCERGSLVIGAHVNGYSDLVGVAAQRAAIVVLGATLGSFGVR